MTWLLGVVAVIAPVIAAWIGHVKGRASGLAEALSRRERELGVVTAELEAKDRAAAREAERQKAVIVGRVVDVAEPTRSEVDAALEREESRMRGGR